MSSRSPSKAQISLEYQIKKRINESDLTKNDLEFYQRKIRRLQNQQSITQDELSKLKVRLRRAEDFEFKYELIFKQNQSLKNDIESANKEINETRSINQQLKIALDEKNFKNQDFSLQKENLMLQVAKWKEKHQQTVEKAKRDLQDERIRCEQTVKHQTQSVKREYSEQVDDLGFEIRQLKKVIQEKQTVEDIINGRVEKIRAQKDQQIQRLQGIITRSKANFEQAIHEKNQNLEKLKTKFQKMLNFDIENLKGNLQDQEEIFNIELNGLREMIGIKNDEIEQLLKEIQRQANEHQANRKELLKEITLLKEKVYSVERQAELELTNLKNRLITIHKEDIKAMEERHTAVEQTLKEDKQELERYLKERQIVAQKDKAEHQRMLDEVQDRLKEKDRRIGELGENMQNRGQLNASEMKNLHESFHKISSEKESIESEYQKNITFLNLQISKLTTANQLKANEIHQLHKEIHDLKLGYEERIRGLQTKNRHQRKQREQQREIERQQRQKTKEIAEDLQRETRNKERRMQRQIEKLEREKNKIKYMLDQSQKDIERLNKYIKQIDESLKSEFKKNQVSTLDKDGLRREVLSELEKQKVAMQALKMMEIDQIKKRYEVELARLNAQNEQLQTDLLNKSLAYQTLQAEFKKLDHKHRNLDRLQQDKIKDYQKKMLTLNQEINITQNLYQTFLQAKSRAQREGISKDRK